MYKNRFPRTGYIKIPKTRFRVDYETPPPPNDSKKRKDKVLEIQSVLSEGRNTIEVVQVMDNKDNFIYMVGIYLCKRFSDFEISEYYLTNKLLSYESSLNMIKEKFNQDQKDSDVQVQIEDDYSLIVKLACPITFTQIKLPVRGERCEHIEWFSLQNYLHLNRSYKTFSCPICKKMSINLVFDNFQSFLLSKIDWEASQLLVDKSLIAVSDDGKVKFDLNQILLEAPIIHKMPSTIQLQPPQLTADEPPNFKKKREEKLIQKEAEQDKELAEELIDLDQSEKICCISVSSSDKI